MTSINHYKSMSWDTLERGMNWKKTSEAMTSKAGGSDCEMYLKCIFFWIKSSVRYEHLNKNTFLMDKTSNVLLFNIHFLKVTFIYFFQLKKMATHSSTQMQSRSDMLRPSYWHHFRPGFFQNSWKNGRGSETNKYRQTVSFSSSPPG